MQKSKPHFSFLLSLYIVVKQFHSDLLRNKRQTIVTPLFQFVSLSQFVHKSGKYLIGHNIQ